MPSELQETWRDLNVPPQDNGCIRCHATVNADDSSLVTWRCAGCNRLVCRACCLTLPGWRRPTEPHGPSVYSHEPGPGGREYFALTLCSKECWEKKGRPEE